MNGDSGEISSFDLVLRKTSVSTTSSKKYGPNLKQSWPTSHPFPLPPPHFLYESGCTCFPSCGMHITWIGMKSESGFNESFFYLNGMPRSKSLSHSILFCHVGRCKMRTVCWKAWLVSQRSDTTGWNFWRIKSFGLHDFKRNPGPSKKVISQKHMKIRYCRYRDA